MATALTEPRAMMVGVNGWLIAGRACAVIGWVLWVVVQLVNDDPYGEGWMIVIKLSNPKEMDGLMSAADYEKLVAAAGH